MTWVIWLALLGLTLGGLTFLFPFTATLAALFKSSPKLPPPDGPIRLEVLIPAFNEAGTIHETLDSVVTAASHLIDEKPEAKVAITVALDGPTDSTREIVAQVGATLTRLNLKGVSFQVLDRGANQGKWVTIGELVAQSRGFWSALVDSGTIWPEKFLLKLSKRLEKSRSVGIAPGYEQTGAGLLSRLIWWQERMIKWVENLAGGPVSLHGATMIFRTEELRLAYHELNTRAWLNDDVVLGLLMRTRGRVSYLPFTRVGDCGARDDESEAGRRRRMALGNVEWIRALFPVVLGESAIVGLLALRRITRVLWAYAFIVSAFAIGMLAGIGPYWSLAATVILTGVASRSRKLREAGVVSLLVPLWMKRKTQVRWS